MSEKTWSLQASFFCRTPLLSNLGPPVQLYLLGCVFYLLLPCSLFSSQLACYNYWKLKFNLSSRETFFLKKKKKIKNKHFRNKIGFNKFQDCGTGNHFKIVEIVKWISKFISYYIYGLFCVFKLVPNGAFSEMKCLLSCFKSNNSYSDKSHFDLKISGKILL